MAGREEWSPSPGSRSGMDRTRLTDPLAVVLADPPAALGGLETDCAAPVPPARKVRRKLGQERRNCVVSLPPTKLLARRLQCCLSAPGYMTFMVKS